MQRLLPLFLILLFPAISFAAPAESKETAAAIADFELADFRGKPWSLGEAKDARLIVAVFLGTECPLVKLYASRLVEIAAKYREQGVTVIGIDSNQQDSLAEMAHFAKEAKIEFPFLKDPGNRVADLFDARRTPEVFVLDQNRKVRYQGRIDDQYTYGIARPEVEHDYLSEAIEALLAGKEVAAAKTETVGCHIGRVLQPQENADVTFSNQISRIFQKRCVECHREGQIAPFALTDYDEAVGWAEMIDEVTQQRRMPPWHANPKHGHFDNDARLTDSELDLIHRWVAAGAPEGDASQLPPPREFAAGWRMGEPDLVLYMGDRPYHVPAKGEVRYQYFLVDPGFTEDKWVKGAECKPGNPAVVHHIIVGIQPPLAERSRIHGSDWLSATAPGARPLQLPDGMAKLIPAGSKLVFQMHYTPNGTAQEDRSCIGLKFADPKEVTQIVSTQKAANNRFRIPPGEESHPVESNYVFSRDATMLALFPHMHLRGKAFRYTATYPDGKSEILLDVPHYDFNWQNGYSLAEPKLMPRGTRIHCEAAFDNSEKNLANPDPTKSVTWGDQTWEEMMIGYFDIAIPVDPGQGGGSPRTDAFLAQAKQDPPVASEALLALAREALESDAATTAFALALHKLLPQADRLDYTSVTDDGRLIILRVTQADDVRRIVLGKLNVRAEGKRLGQYASGEKTVVHADITTIKEDDFQFLARAFKSSIHLPLEHAGVPGSLNLWSKEPAAFPPEAVKLLEDVVMGMRAASR